MTQRPTAMKVVVIEPKVFEDSENITHQLRDMRPVLINLKIQILMKQLVLQISYLVRPMHWMANWKKVGKDIFHVCTCKYFH